MHFIYFQYMWNLAGKLSAGAALMLFLGACGGSDNAASTNAPAEVTATATIAPTTAPPPTTTLPPTTVAPTTTPPTTQPAEPTDQEIEAEIIAAYLQGWDDYYAVLEDTSLDPSFARATHTVEADEILVSDQQELRDDNRQVQWPENSLRKQTVEVLRLEGSSATIRDCFVNDSFGIRPNGEIVNSDLETLLWAAEMRLEDEVWKTLSTELIRAELGVNECA